MEFKPQLRQRQGLSVVMQYGLQVLVMPYSELEAHVEQELLNNPLLEVAEEGERRRSAPGIRLSSGTDLPLEEDRLAIQEEPSMRDYLLSQIEPGRLPTEDTPVLEALISMVDLGTGLLPYEEMAADMGLPEPSAAVLRCLEVLRTLDPPGICAQDMPHALCRQLDVRGQLDKAAEAVVLNCLPLVAQGKFGVIAKTCGVPVVRVKRIAEQIRACRPHLTMAFSADQPVYLIPDVRFSIENGRLETEVCTGWMGFLRISAFYDRYCAEASDEETKAYLQDKLERARRVMQFMHQRQQTLQRISELILTRQRNFLNEKGPLCPLSMKEAAAELGMHPSTVGRAVRGKYAQTPAGILPLRRFFTSYVRKEDHLTGTEAVKSRISELISAESPQHPLSDAQLQVLLQQEGLKVARRTVAKYREQLVIPPAAARRRRETSGQ